MKYSIRPLTVNKLPDILTITNNGIRADFPMYDKKTQTAYIKMFNRRFYRKLLTKKGNVVLGASVKDKLVGILGVKDDTGGAAFIEWFIVKKEFRGQGIGIALLDACEKWALENKYHYVYFYTETAKNIEFYKKRGYEYIGKFRKSWFGVDEHAMQKVLRDKPFEEIYKS